MTKVIKVGQENMTGKRDSKKVRELITAKSKQKEILKDLFIILSYRIQMA